MKVIKTVNSQAENKKAGSAAIRFPSSFTPKLAANFIPLINNLNVRRAIIPALNLHSSARALARFYAALVDVDTKIFTNTKENIHDACLGRGDHKDLILQNGQFGLGFSISVALNQVSSGALPGEIIRFICSELDLPVPEDYAESRDFTENPKIN
ncbi:beta-lactamase/transpeptidase-like protein [Artemisia annua]|uniref:Beta-lactamase/transpeptidase-like protein n=1 Tax=Artemisia annua TaxID=35608 RepID=A0A2U1Q085_ARTAN|nr:beta-lactamase/transpeptidase-like protein [Artemisia annua]